MMTDGWCARSGVWETEYTENAEAFVDAVGVALTRRFAGRIDLKELRHVAHEDDRLEDTTVSGNVAMTNVSAIDAWTEIVNSDGSTMRTRARWDGDVWVETDDCLLMETRRWMEKTSMIVARTVTASDGTLVTMKQFFRRFVKDASVEANAAAAIGAANAAADAAKIAEQDDKASDADDASMFAEAIDFGSRMFSGLGFGAGSPRAAQLEMVDIVKMFKLPADTELLATFECSIVTPSTSAASLASKGDKGTLYVVKYAFLFVSDDKNSQVKWIADAMAIQELTVEGVNSISMETADGSKIKLNGMKRRDDAFDSMIAMLESMPNSEEPSPAMDARPCGPPLKFGFRAESYVFLHLIDVSVEGAASKMAGTPVTTITFGETSNTVHSKSPVPTGFGGICANIGQTLALSMASLNEFDGEHVSILVRDDRGEEVGEAMLPVAALPHGSDGRAHVRSAPFIVHLSVPRVKVEAGAVGLRTKPVSKNAARGVGSLNIAAWIGSSAEAIGMGVRNDGEEGTIATKATVRVTPASSAITVVARSVRGLPHVEGESIRCILTYGSQRAETSSTNFSMADDMKFSFGEASFNAEAPCTGAIRVEIVTTETGNLLGTTELDVMKLPRRKTDRHGNVAAAPSGRYHKLYSGDEGDDEDVGFVFLQAYVDPAVTYSQSQKPVLGELSIKVLKLNGLPESCAPALIANVGDAWALLPGFGGGGPSGWKRELHAAVRDAADQCTIGIYNRNKSDEMLGKIKFSPFSLPEHGRALVCTVPLTTRDVFGSGDDNGEATVRLQFKQKVSNTALFFHYCTPMLPMSAYRYGDMDEIMRDLDIINYEHLVTGRDALPEPLVRSILDVSDTDPSIATTRRTKASAMRLAATLESFGDVLKPLTQAVTWEKPMYTAALHISIFMCLWLPRLTFVGYFAFIAWYISLRNKPRVFTALGEDKSKLAGSVNVSKAPPGSTLSPLSSLVRESYGVAARATPSNDAYDAVVQISFWCQAQVEFLRAPLEKFNAILTWEDESESAKYQTLFLGAAVGFLFIPFRFVAAAILFVCLRHPWAAKPPLPPYKVALARRSIAPAA